MSFSIATGFSQWIKNEANSIGFSQNYMTQFWLKPILFTFFHNRQLKQAAIDMPN
jgi:hypothetical protein